MARVIPIASGCLVALLGCSSGKGNGESIVVSTGSLIPQFDPNVADYAVSSLNSVYPIEVTATTVDPSTPITIHGAAAASGIATSFRLRPREDFTVTLGWRKYTIHYLPPDFPAYTVTPPGAGAGDEDILLTAGSYAFIVDRSGNPVYYRTFGVNAENFQQHRIDGGTTTYSVEVGTFNDAWILGVQHLMDDHFRDTGDVRLVPTASHDTLPAEGHDFLLLGDQHYLSMSYVQRTVDMSKYDPAWSTKTSVVYDVVQEIDHGKPVFEWDSENVPSLYFDCTDGDDFGPKGTYDYLHLNSMDVDPSDGNFVFSFRYASSVVKVDRKTAKIVWTLGGKEDQFGLLPEQTFSWQHYVRFQPDGSLMVFDNGNADSDGNEGHQTRILRFALDEANRKVVSFTDVYDKPADQPPSTVMGSYAQLGANRWLFGWGGWGDGSIEPAVTETVGGSVVWSLTLTKKNLFSYRALPIGKL